ncbi:protein shifted isoform X2 [Contarinia nasturtii]|uniref:protein shifted isoform X2 n=1 Tax=Contarinia nasturtii TaxID=265458 RepID=UPI0012D42988|nr:protein shifted isoform X2 [Contarinia nasturtii]
MNATERVQLNIIFFIRSSKMNKFQHLISMYLVIGAIFLASNSLARQNHQHTRKYSTYPDYDNDLSLWISEAQVKRFSGYSMKVYAIYNGSVSMHLISPNFNNNLPIIPSELTNVNFTWRSGTKKYYYHFDRLQSLDESILKPPTVSIRIKGKVPQEAKDFSVFLPCKDNSSGIAMFSIGLLITSRGKPIPGTPLRLNLRKECAQRAPDPECNKKCANGGWCNHDKICQCPEGYMGQYCQTALCYPQCMNGGFCSAPAVCSCPKGYQGRHCEGGICEQKCLNGGKCIQKDKCQCTKGFYGSHCQFSKCIIPCSNGGKCNGNNKCRCPDGFAGDHCEVENSQRLEGTCKKPCGHGICMSHNKCKCYKGFFGRYCNQRGKRHNRNGERL